MRTPAILILTTLVTGAVSAQDSAGTWTHHFQLTAIQQAHPPFRAPYSGKNSLSPGSESFLSVTSTLFLGCRTWPGGEFYCDPELAGGSGFSGTRGIAGFPNGEIYRVDNPAPKVFIARFFLQHRFALGEGHDQVEDGENQIAGTVPASRLTLSAGKRSLTDIFDDTRYSHDARTQFMNWSLWSGGAWDYAADTRGYNWGMYAELHFPDYDANFAAVMVPTTPNGPSFDGRLDRAYSLNLELVRRYTVADLRGSVHMIWFLNRAFMGGYRDALADAAARGGAPEIDATGRYSPKYGFVLSMEQALGNAVGVFGRISWNDGQRETWAFTEIDRSLQAGLSADGSAWGRNEDRAGIAFAVNGLSGEHRDYLAAGGMGFILGDGALTYAPEFVTEAYYAAALFPSFTLTLDDQLIVNPGYNSARGPLVHVVSLRGHVEI